MRLTTWPGIIIDIGKDFVMGDYDKELRQMADARRKMFVFRICIGSANIFR